MDGTTSFVQELLALVPELKPVHEEHVSDDGGPLPHVFLGDVTRFAIAEAEKGEQSDILMRILAKMETGLIEHDDKVSELVAVSFVENLCGEDVLKSLRPMMGPNLRKEVETICGE